MHGNLLKSRLFGYKKSDVIKYINSLDEQASKNLQEARSEAEAYKAEATVAKAELAALKAELEESRKNRDAIVSVLEIAQNHAKEIIENAQKTADEIETGARSFAEKEKSNLNREIEIKKRDINNHFLAENKKIAALRKEIEEMRQMSLRSIKKFEQDLGNIESLLEQKENITNKAMTKADSDAENFFDSIRTVPIRVIKPENPEHLEEKAESV